MIKKLVTCFCLLAVAVASAASHKLTLFQPSIVNGTELKPGDYNMEINDQTVVIKKGRQTVEAPVKVETADLKFSNTTVRYQNGDGKYRVQEIRVGGTKTRLIFN
jgi:hypothetical protein